MEDQQQQQQQTNYYGKELYLLELKELLENQYRVKELDQIINKYSDNQNKSIQDNNEADQMSNIIKQQQNENQENQDIIKLNNNSTYNLIKYKLDFLIDEQQYSTQFSIHNLKIPQLAHYLSLDEQMQKQIKQTNSYFSILAKESLKQEKKNLNQAFFISHLTQLKYKILQYSTQTEYEKEKQKINSLIQTVANVLNLSYDVMLQNDQNLQIGILVGICSLKDFDIMRKKQKKVWSDFEISFLIKNLFITLKKLLDNNIVLTDTFTMDSIMLIQKNNIQSKHSHNQQKDQTLQNLIIYLDATNSSINQLKKEDVSNSLKQEQLAIGLKFISQTVKILLLSVLYKQESEFLFDFEAINEYLSWTNKEGTQNPKVEEIWSQINECYDSNLIELIKNMENFYYKYYVYNFTSNKSDSSKNYKKYSQSQQNEECQDIELEIIVYDSLYITETEELLNLVTLSNQEKNQLEFVKNKKDQKNLFKKVFELLNICHTNFFFEDIKKIVSWIDAQESKEWEQKIKNDFYLAAKLLVCILQNQQDQGQLIVDEINKQYQQQGNFNKLGNSIFYLALYYYQQENLYNFNLLQMSIIKQQTKLTLKHQEILAKMVFSFNLKFSQKTEQISSLNELLQIQQKFHKIADQQQIITLKKLINMQLQFGDLDQATNLLEMLLNNFTERIGYLQEESDIYKNQLVKNVINIDQDQINKVINLLVDLYNKKQNYQKAKYYQKKIVTEILQTYDQINSQDNQDALSFLFNAINEIDVFIYFLKITEDQDLISYCQKLNEIIELYLILESQSEQKQQQQDDLNNELTLSNRQIALEIQQKLVNIDEQIKKQIQESTFLNQDQCINEAEITNEYGIMYLKNYKYTDSLYFFLQSFYYLNQIQDISSEQISNSCYNIGLVYQAMNEHIEAIKFFEKSMYYQQQYYKQLPKSEQKRNFKKSKMNLKINYRIAEEYITVGEFQKAQLIIQQQIQILQNQNGEQEEFIGDFYNLYGLAALEQCKFEEAQVYLNGCYQIWLKTLGQNSYAISVALNNIAVLCIQTTKYQDLALTNLMESIKIIINLKGNADNLDAIEILNNFGALYYYQGNYKQAKRYYKKCLDSCYQTNLDKVRHEMYAIVLNNQGIIQCEYSKFIKGNCNIQKALDMWKIIYRVNQEVEEINSEKILKFLGNKKQRCQIDFNQFRFDQFKNPNFKIEHINLAICAHNLVYSLLLQQKFDIVQIIQKNYIKYFVKRYGEQHILYYKAMNNMIYQNITKKTIGYIQELNKVISMKHYLLQTVNDNLLYGQILNNLAVYLLNNTYNSQICLQYLIQSKQFYEKIGMNQHQDLANVNNNIGIYYCQMNQYNKAYKQFKIARAYSINNFDKPEKCLDYILSEYYNFKAKFLEKKIKENKKGLKKSLYKLSNIYPMKHQFKAIILKDIAYYYEIVKHNIKKAIGYQELARDIYIQQFGMDTKHLQFIYHQLCHLYFDLDQHKQTIEAWQQYIEMIKLFYGEKSKMQIIPLQNLAFNQAYCQKYDESVANLQKSAKLLQKCKNNGQYLVYTQFKIFQTYFDAGNFQQAFQQGKILIEMVIKQFSEKSPKLHLVYTTMSTICQVLDDQEMAQQYLYDAQKLPKGSKEDLIIKTILDYDSDDDEDIDYYDKEEYVNNQTNNNKKTKQNKIQSQKKKILITY